MGHGVAGIFEFFSHSPLTFLHFLTAFQESCMQSRPCDPMGLAARAIHSGMRHREAKEAATEPVWLKILGISGFEQSAACVRPGPVWFFFFDFARFSQVWRQGPFLRTRYHLIYCRGTVLALLAAIEPGLSRSSSLPVTVWGQLTGGRRGDAWDGQNGFL